MSTPSSVADVTSPRAARAQWGEPQILHPALRHDRAPYRHTAVSPDHILVQLHRRHVADVRRNPEGGWDLFAVERPALAIGWAGTPYAMQTLAAEALPAQAHAQPGCYVWCLLWLSKVEAYRRPLPLAEVA